MLCTKFGRNWSGDFGDKDKKCKKITTTTSATDNGQIWIRASHLSNDLKSTSMTLELIFVVLNYAKYQYDYFVFATCM